MENTETNSTGTTEEFVSIPDADDADLDAFIAESSRREAGEESSTQPVESKEATSKEELTEPAPKKETATDSDPIDSDRPITRREFEEILSRQQKSEKRIDSQEFILQRRTSEIGELKRANQEKIRALSTGLEEKQIENPVQFTRDVLQIERLQDTTAELDREAEQISHLKTSRDLTSAYVKELDVDGMAEVLKEDGIEPEYVEYFKRNPHQFMHAETLIQTAKRAETKKQLNLRESQLSQVIGFAKQLQEENKKLKERPQSILQKVEAQLKQPAQITASQNGSSSGDTTLSDPSQMSDAELDEFLKQSKR